MREILFRGKRTDNDAWFEGSLIHCDLMDGRSYTCILEPDDSYSSPWEFPYLCCETGCIDGYARPVKPETVGQYTGLTDKNGKKIFEGDIVYIIPEDENGVIEWRDDEAMFMLNADGWCANFDNYYSWDVEVIGNIHDNPELLEEECQNV